MKRIVAILMVLFVALTACMAVSATSFDVDLYCAGTDDNCYAWLQGPWRATADGAVYVYHNVDAPGGHTNHFRVYPGTQGGSAKANKWCTPGQNIRIACSSIKANKNVWLKARGNTKYQQMDYDYIYAWGTYGRPLK